MSHDEKCEELARHFLQDDMFYKDKEAAVIVLSSLFQAVAEDFMSGFGDQPPTQVKKPVDKWA